MRNKRKLPKSISITLLTIIGMCLSSYATASYIKSTKTTSSEEPTAVATQKNLQNTVAKDTNM